MVIEVRSSKYGRGVFAKNAISKGSIIETCPVILLPDNFENSETEAQLERFQFNWINGLKCLALGFGSIYNHSENPNALFLPNYENKTIVFIALENISADQEIFTDYGYQPKSNTAIEKKIESASKSNTLSSFIIESTIFGLRNE